MAGHTQRAFARSRGGRPIRRSAGGGGHRGRGQGGQRRRRHGAGCGTWLPGKRSPAGPGPRRYRLYRLSASLSRLPWGSDAACPTYLSSVARSTPPDQSQSPCPPPSSSAGRPYSRHTSPAPRLTGARTRLRQGPLPARALRVVNRTILRHRPGAGPDLCSVRSATLHCPASRVSGRRLGLETGQS